ncbi:MAG: nucleotidyltransferase [Cyanobium sp.]|nr:MAG: nucleotidyltransferase [Cyanobium sp.]
MVVEPNPKSPQRNPASFRDQGAAGSLNLPGSWNSSTLNEPDVRWQQRFSNYCRALEQLESFFEHPVLNPREELGLIKAFESSFELGWNTLRDLLKSESNSDLVGSRDTLRGAYRVGLISHGTAWMAMIQDRNLTSHTYNRSTAIQIATNIREGYLECFRQLRATLQQRAS